MAYQPTIFNVADMPTVLSKGDRYQVYLIIERVFWIDRRYLMQH
jgi:hypothetical protein